MPECDRSSAETMEVLGTSWNLTADTIFINKPNNLSYEATTKRDALGHKVRLWVHFSKNPADLAARGVPADELIHNNLWWHGPSWLTDLPSQWPPWKSTQFDTKMSEQNTKQCAGSHVNNKQQQ